MEKKNKSYKIDFKGIELVSKLLEEPKELQGGEIKFHFNFISDLKLFPPNKTVFIVTEITISETISNRKLALFKTLCMFTFPDFENIFKLREDDKFDIPLNLEITLKSAGISTSRGIIYSELRGTYLSNATLPLIDIASIIINDRRKLNNETG